MKTLSGMRKFYAGALVLIIAAVIISCDNYGPFVPIPPEILAGKPKVAIKADGSIIVPRALKVSADDLKKLNAILSSHDKRLYKVTIYNKGQRKEPPIGISWCVPNKAVEIVDQAATAAGASNVAIEFVPKKGTSGTAKACSAPNILTDQAQDLREKVTPILRKYSGNKKKL